MKLFKIESTTKKITKVITACCLILVFNACRTEKNNYQILKNSKPDSSIYQNNYGSIKGLEKIKKADRGALLFDQYIADNFKLPKKKKDSAAIVKYFIETSYAQLGRREFRQWDIVVIRGVSFQVNVDKNPKTEHPLFKDQAKIEVMGMVFLLLGFYFL
jgi:hypothetical protein